MIDTESKPLDGECAVSWTRLKNGTVFLRVAGEVDLYTAPMLRRTLTEVLTDEAAAPALVIDLCECDFLDSAAVGVLLEADSQVQRAGGRLALVAPRPEIRKVFELTGLDRLLVIHDSRQSALGIPLDA